MDHSCHRCHAAIPDAAPFCAQCGAPQIRVSEESVIQGDRPDLQKPGAPLSNLDSATSIDWRAGFSAAFKAGAVMALLSGLVSIFCCLWVPLGGALSVRFYLRKTPAATGIGGLGARLGALAGLLGFVMFLCLQIVFFALGHFVFHQELDLRKSMIEVVTAEQKVIPSLDVAKLIEWINTPEVLATMIAISLAIYLLAFLVFGAIGGALGQKFQRARRQQ